MAEPIKTINLTPHHCEAKSTDNGFDLIWYARSENDKDYRVVLHLRMWWIRFIARDLWRMLGEKKSEIAEQESALTNGAKA